MKQLKIIGLAAMAVSALMAFAGSASAAVLTSPSGTEYTGEFHMTLATPNSSLIKAGVETTCGESTVAGKVETNGAGSASGKISNLTFGDCTKTTDVLSRGSVTIASGGAFWLIGSEWTFFDLGVSCVYGGGAGTKLGTLKGGTPAVLEVSTTELKRISGSTLFCNATGTWTAKYTVTTPSTLLVD